ncbi:nucleoside-triphosphatase [Winogradskyella ouciana]|uniref:Nucleoside-triphosphatase THEP1 n=1 Tax=Winogradskyella ouciana TaxID=2608631 RepID=A0A7K1GEY4_9FLAO|nr:nucleoside-triphosphatase [Winogradskyella ouciana]MTE26449.1 hypothetical protein [Winogradskyella ouciana]
MIYILTGDIRTGKTTALLNWIEGRADVDGVLCPDSENGKRYFLNIKTKEEYFLGTNLDTEENKIISIGAFQFLKSSFQKANNYLLEANEKRVSKYLIIDELGKLELKYNGLHDSAKVLIPKYEKNKDHYLILVVRESLFDDILEHYNISEYSVLKKDGLRLFD